MFLVQQVQKHQIGVRMRLFSGCVCQFRIFFFKSRPECLSDNSRTILYVPLPFLPWLKTGLKNEHARKVLKLSSLVFLCVWMGGVTVMWAEGPGDRWQILF